jgi:sugar phosphate isomerase/epimerase
MGITQLAGSTAREAGTSVPQISLGSWAFSFGPFEKDPWSFDRFAKYAAKHRYDGVEINGFRPHPHDEDYSALAARDLSARLAADGLGVSGYAPDLRSTPPGEVSLDDYLSRISSVARFCEAAGITTVRVDTITGPGGPTGIDPAAARRALVTAWKRSADDLASAGVELVWEFEPGFWINRPSQVLALVEEIDRPNFGILFDSSHAHTVAAYGARQGDGPELLPGGAVDYARLLAPWVRHLHLIDSDGSLHDGDTSEHLPFGAGEIAFPAVLDALGEAAARLPWWTVDFCFWPDTVRDAAVAVPVVTQLRDSFIARLNEENEAS